MTRRDGLINALETALENERAKVRDLERRLEAARSGAVPPRDERRYRVIGAQPGDISNIPLRLIENRRESIEKFHGQTLERLAERGGLSAGEIMLHITGDRRWIGSMHKHASQELEKYVKAEGG